jgi:hypothetical protein
MANRRIAQQVRTSRPTVVLWRKRFGASTLARNDPPSLVRIDPPLT